MGGAELTTSKPAHVDRGGSTWVSPFTLRSGHSYTQQRQKRPCTAQRKRGEFRRSWRLIWGASLGWRSSPQLAMFPCPGSAVGLCRDKCACVLCVCVCPERGHNVVDHSDITHISSSAGQIKQAGSQLELSGDSKKEVAVSCWCVCVNPVITKPPFAAHCASNSTKTPSH